VRSFAGASIRLGVLLPGEFENIPPVEGPVRKEAVHHVLLIEEHIEKDSPFCRYQEIHLRLRHVQQNDPAARPSECYLEEAHIPALSIFPSRLQSRMMLIFPAAM